ncbi:uncharacterized protein N7503_003309 [Penicillium pulvis]|uniref:uncharacterized protein n=1 Tax=Penicillium pulvis TaxID=1562058 RepID=UPI002548FC47|nr:uncharacterized protein N7503_003309 [Penicillium pulvis]KAJ5805707.1 hypothetical protein N7503_003309 [Penicillium pulvis]
MSGSLRALHPPSITLPTAIPNDTQTTPAIGKAPTGGPPPKALTTETLYTTQVSTVYQCASTVKNCPYSEKTPSAVTQVVATATTVYPVTTFIAGETSSGASPAESLTTETLYTTEISTVYKCASTVKNCPYADKTPSAVTQVIATGTTVYPVTTSIAGKNPGGAALAESLTTETLYTSEYSTIYKCASTVKDCPYDEKTPSIIAQISATGTTVYPVTTSIAKAAPSDAAPADNIFTETLYRTEFSTVYKCASSVKDCPYAEKTPSTITQMIPTGTNFYSITTSTGSTIRAHTITACPYDADECSSSEETTYVTSKSEETYTVILVSAETPVPHTTATNVEPNDSAEVTPTVYVTDIVTVLACPAPSTLTE